MTYEQQESTLLNALGNNIRKCHDCGKPTSNYRCQACWYKLRNGPCPSVLDDTYIYYANDISFSRSKVRPE